MPKRKKKKQGKMSGALAMTMVVVIFIVVVLAVVVLVAMGNLRAQANDVRVATGVIQVGLLSRTHKDTQNDTYTNFDTCVEGSVAACAGGIAPTMSDLLAEIYKANPDANVVSNISSDGTAYCASATLPESGESRCVDSSGLNLADKDLQCLESGLCEGTAETLAEPDDDDDDPVAVPTPTPPPLGDVVACQADVNRDGVVDMADLFAVGSKIVTIGEGIPEDASRNGVVNSGDLVFVGAYFGTDCSMFYPAASPTPTPTPTPTATPLTPPRLSLVTTSTRIATGNDDVEERPLGSLKFADAELEMTWNLGRQMVGYRFVNTQVPPGSEISRAHIQFATGDPSSGATNLTIYGEAIDSSPTFREIAGRKVSDRSATNASVAWSPVAWNTATEAGEAQQTPDLASVIQEIVDRPGWHSDHAMVFMIVGTGERTALSYDAFPELAAELVVTYDPDPSARPGRFF